MKVYFLTSKDFSVYVYTDFGTPAKRYFYTNADTTVYFYTETPITFKRYIYTDKTYTRYFLSEPRFNGEDPFYSDNNCKYPSELELIRQKAILEYYKQVKVSLLESISKEYYGKVSFNGYVVGSKMRLLLEYLSSIWIERKNDSLSGIVRSTTYYWDKYDLSGVIESFRKCYLNAKPIIDLFNLKTYEVEDGDWPNYNIINQVTNPPTSQDTLTLRQFRDIYTNQSISAQSGEAIHSLSGGQTSFNTTKKIKYMSSFIVAGSDYLGTAVEWSNKNVTYSPSVLFGYNISSSDTVTITYWYEE